MFMFGVAVFVIWGAFSFTYPDSRISLVALLDAAGGVSERTWLLLSCAALGILILRVIWQIII
jgi:hypothetical protein